MFHSILCLLFYSLIGEGLEKVGIMITDFELIIDQLSVQNKPFLAAHGACLVDQEK